MRTFRAQIRHFLPMLAFLGVLGWFVLFSGLFLVRHEVNTPNRAALLRMHGEIVPGSAPADVREVYRRNATPSLKLLEHPAWPWAVRMPIEWGGTDWLLFVDFQEGRVSSVRMRTSDGPAPEGGPPDRPQAAHRPAPPIPAALEHQKPR